MELLITFLMFYYHNINSILDSKGYTVVMNKYLDFE